MKLNDTQIDALEAYRAAVEEVRKAKEVLTEANKKLNQASSRLRKVIPDLSVSGRSSTYGVKIEDEEEEE